MDSGKLLVNLVCKSTQRNEALQLRAIVVNPNPLDLENWLECPQNNVGLGTEHWGTRAEKGSRSEGSKQVLRRRADIYEPALERLHLTRGNRRFMLALSSLFQKFHFERH